MGRVISTRPERPGDDGDFLRAVYASTRQPELTVLSWPAAEQDAFIRMQFEAQTRHYRTAFPAASRSVICVDDEPAGRLIVNRCNDEIRIVDIALLPAFRGTGIGSEVVARLLVEADAAGLPVTCHVLAGNQARRFWERAGFVAAQDDEAYIPMERPCGT